MRKFCMQIRIKYATLHALLQTKEEGQKTIFIYICLIYVYANTRNIIYSHKMRSKHRLLNNHYSTQIL